MKCVILAMAALTMVSCNTSIGIWRDTKVGFNWTKDKIQGVGSGGGGTEEIEYEYGAPVY